MSTKKLIWVFSANPTIPIFRKWLIFVSFCEARSKMVSKKRRATKLTFLKNAFLPWFFNVCLCVFIAFWVILTLLVILGPNLVVFAPKRKKVNFATRRRQIHPTSLKNYFVYFCWEDFGRIFCNFFILFFSNVVFRADSDFVHDSPSRGNFDFRFFSNMSDQNQTPRILE